MSRKTIKDLEVENQHLKNTLKDAIRLFGEMDVEPDEICEQGKEFVERVCTELNIPNPIKQEYVVSLLLHESPGLGTMDDDMILSRIVNAIKNNAVAVETVDEA